jgi:hypothetical protein
MATPRLPSRLLTQTHGPALAQQTSPTAPPEKPLKTPPWRHLPLAPLAQVIAQFQKTTIHFEHVLNETETASCMHRHSDDSLAKRKYLFSQTTTNALASRML